MHVVCVRGRNTFTIREIGAYMRKTRKRNSAPPKEKKASAPAFNDAQMEVFSTLLLYEKADALQTVAAALIAAGKAVEAAAEKIRRAN